MPQSVTHGHPFPEFQSIRIVWTPMPGRRPYRLEWEDGELVREWRGPRTGQAITCESWDAAHRAINHLPRRVLFSKPRTAQTLPMMPRPEFGGVRLLPAFETQMPYSGPQPDYNFGLFATAQVNDAQPSLLDTIEQGYLASEYGDCADLVEER